MRAVARAAAVVVLSVLAIAGCGGGGGSSGGSGGGSSGGSGNTSVSLATHKVDVVAAYGDNAPTGTVRITARNLPADGIYLRASATGTAVIGLDFISISATQMDLLLYLRPPVQLPVGTATALVTVEACYDQTCTRTVKGSPSTVSVNYSVEDRSAVSLATASPVSVKADFNDVQASGSAVINVTRPPSGALAFFVDSGSLNVFSVENLTGAGSTVDLKLNFRSPSTVGMGVHAEDVKVRVCYDYNCLQEVPGSPLTIPTRYEVTRFIPPESSLDPLPYQSRIQLTHDVVDAEYDRALERIVMVSSWPDNALYLYDPSNGTEKKLNLNKVPTAVSVSPDGRYAAVGHDALITHVDLPSVIAGAPVTKLLDVTTQVLDIVLDGRGVAHALPAADQWVNVHSVNVATNSETLGMGSLYAGTLGRLHPSGDYMYTANNNLSPSDIAKYDLRSGTANELYDSPYHGDYAMCGDLWIKEDGATIYTKCGNTFRSSTTRAQDMIYSGRLTLSVSSTYGYQIQSLSESDATGEILLVEKDWYECASFNTGGKCYSHVATYESTFLNRTRLYSLPPMEINSISYYQEGLWVFHGSNGANRYLISRLKNMPAGQPAYYLTKMQ